MNLSKGEQWQMADTVVDLIRREDPCLFEPKWQTWRQPISDVGVLCMTACAGSPSFLKQILSIQAYKEQLDLRNYISDETVLDASLRAKTCKNARILLRAGMKITDNSFVVCVREWLSEMGIFLCDSCSDFWFLSYWTSGSAERVREWQHIAKLRRSRALAAFVVFLALCKSKCDRNVYAHILLPMLRNLWANERVSPYWEK